MQKRGSGPGDLETLAGALCSSLGLNERPKPVPGFLEDRAHLKLTPCWRNPVSSGPCSASSEFPYMGMSQTRGPQNWCFSLCFPFKTTKIGAPSKTADPYVHASKEWISPCFRGTVSALRKPTSLSSGWQEDSHSLVVFLLLDTVAVVVKTNGIPFWGR